jgi:transcriptional regulator GlxA family with amidase domain
MIKITFLAVEGCLSSSISNLIDAFTIANLWHKYLSGKDVPLFAAEVVALEGKPIISSGCMQITPHSSLTDSANSDYLIIPAFVPVPESCQMQDPQILDYLCHQHSSGTTLAAVCTGSFLLAETGLLNGKTATTNWQFSKKFSHRYPEVNLEINSILTEENNLICTGAATAIMNLALKIIKKEGSGKLASVCAKALLIDPNRNSQAPYSIYIQSESHKDVEILKAEQYMREHLNSDIGIDEVAQFVCISSRHFKRRFKNATGDSPLNYLQKLRIEEAKNRLENTLDSISEITRRVGYGDDSTFRRLFKRHTSLSPREYRDKFLQLES